MKRALSLILAIAMICCSWIATAATAEDVELGDTLTVAVGNDPETLNPGIAASNARYERLVYSGLVCQEGKEIVPDLAESWEVSEDGLVWTFHLRDNVYFTSSGKKLTAADVKATYTEEQPQLKRVVWPASLLDGSAFAVCTQLEEILYRGSELQWNLTTSKDLFEGVKVVYDYQD